MATGRGGATAGRRRAALALALIAPLALLTACASPTSSSAPSPTPTASASPSPTPAPTPPAALCARLISHWSRELLDTTAYGDYQSMGLSNGQYAILRDVVDAARSALKREGPVAAEELIDGEAEQRCAARYRDGAPTEGPWS
ncbi:hypothetical protein AB0O01_14890 [Streptomyces sp. NPDC093252]|uniref:hypothetical protein n=1 Tax=Streptomyces sp. NPDC093252 TaxID=3154980 RepID=UPI00341F1B75